MFVKYIILQKNTSLKSKYNFLIKKQKSDYLIKT